MNFKKIKELTIAHSTYDYLSDLKKNIDYNTWVDYIDSNIEIFIWAEDTKDGKQNLANIDKVPESFQERVLIAHNKHRCFADFDIKKQNYNIAVSYYDMKIEINLNRAPKLKDLKIFLQMAKHLNALLLKDCTEIIDEKVIESLL